ncbi:MAG: Polysaccharide deacetylase [candidate division BRC1 bacterium ADurb.BinA364]|nr:MAG: Polysaccharide deacetylase [candidate division BRC1 bacterium ADurb.BinA364]
MNPAAPAKRYIVELHDLRPGAMAEIESMLAMLPLGAASTAAALVTPRWENRESLADRPEFVSRMAALGGEIALHGWTHSLGPDWLNALFSGTENHSEFARLDEAEAARRLALSAEAFEAAFGRRPRWFCAPRWQQGKAVDRALIRAGFEGWMLAQGYRRSRGGLRRIPPLSFDWGERWPPQALRAWIERRAMSRALRAEAPFRLALHPADMRRAGTRRRIAAFLHTLERAGWAPLDFREAAAS